MSSTISAELVTLCISHRVGRTMNAQKGFTTIDARLDIVAALAYIRASQSVDMIYIIAHCAGSVALAAASWMVLYLRAGLVALPPLTYS
jgi:hypothetical protein